MDIPGSNGGCALGTEYPFGLFWLFVVLRRTAQKIRIGSGFVGFHFRNIGQMVRYKLPADTPEACALALPKLIAQCCITHTYTHIHTHTPIHTQKQTHTHSHTHSHTHTQYTHKHTHIHTFTHSTHMHTQRERKVD